jgi:hypothetical protein
MTRPEVVRAAELLSRTWEGSPPAELDARERCRQLALLLRRHDPSLVAEAERSGSAPDAPRLRQALMDAAQADGAMRMLLGQLADPRAATQPRNGGQHLSIQGNGNQAVQVGGSMYGSLPDAPTRPPPAKPRILYLAASPLDKMSLRIDQEQREIREALALAGDRYVLEPRPAVRPRDVTLALTTVRPRIVHFGGHGENGTGAVCLEDELGNTHPVEGRALASILRTLRGEIECVVLNSCYSALQANAIAGDVPYVVGMSNRVGDEAAIAFATGFYQAVGSGASVPQAVGMGRGLFEMMNIPENLAPILLHNGVAVS